MKMKISSKRVWVELPSILQKAMLKDLKYSLFINTFFNKAELEEPYKILTG